MILYHGSNMAIRQIDLNKSKPNKDFGRGFYLSENETQAIEMAADLAELLAKDYGMSITEALDALYNSDTYAKLNDPDTGLYFQSSQYVYSFLKTEIETGSVA